MARVGNKRFEVRMQDRLTDSEILFYYSLPSTRDRFQFQDNFLKRNGNDVDYDLIEDQLEIGLRVLTGVREGDFLRDVDGEHVPLSSDKDSPNFFPQWKEWLKEYASDLLESFVLHVFRGQNPIVGAKKEELPAGK